MLASIMLKLAMALGITYIIICVVFAAFPDPFLSVIDWHSVQGNYISVTSNAVFGLILVLTAPASRAPIGYRVIGAWALLGAVFYLLIPLELWQAQLSWWMVEQRTFVRIASVLFGLPLGVFIAYAAIPAHDPRKD